MIIDLTRDRPMESEQSVASMQLPPTHPKDSPPSSTTNGSSQTLSVAATSCTCCICLEENDYRGSPLLRCVDCSILVHAQCYGTSALQAAAWRCEVCQARFDTANAPDNDSSNHVDSVFPKCAICHIAGGALRRTTEANLWSHVLCAQWIPELNHSFTGGVGELIDINILNASRAQLRCIVCGQRGGCIQCVSGRCARSFHVICALRAPSDVIFTGYNNNIQIYHCKMHVNDVPKQAQRICDESWKDLPQVKQLITKFPAQEGRCRYCNLKLVVNQHSSHEEYCLLALVSKEDAKSRKDHIDEVARIVQQNAKARAKANHFNEVSTNRQLDDDPSLPSTPVSMRVQSPTRPSTGKNKRKGFTRRPCPECGMLVPDVNLQNHLQRECDQRDQRPRAKKPNKQQQKRRRKSTTPASSCASSPCGTPRDASSNEEMTDVLFGYWPGNLSGSPLNSTYFWKLITDNFFGTCLLRKRRTDQVCRSLVGVRLDDVGKRLRPNEATDCSEQAFFLRKPDTNVLSLHSVIHRCDAIMRASKIHCVEDPDAKAVVELLHARPQLQLAPGGASDTGTKLFDGEIRVLFKNSQHEQVACRYKMHLSQAKSNDPQQEEREQELFANACWSEFQHNLVSSMSGEAIEQSLLPLKADEKLWVSLDIDEELAADAQQMDGLKDFNDELTPEISVLVERLKVQMRVNRYSLRNLYRQLQATMAKDKEQHRLNAIVAAYYQELAWWQGLVANLLVGYKPLHIKQKEAAEEAAKQAAVAASEGEHSSNASSPTNEEEEIDDGTCVICFDGQSPETNPIIFCDRCNLAVHQKCYGVVNVPSSEFYCDRCLDEDPTTSVFCQLCPLRDGAFKRTVDGKWVHVVCALWCPDVWIANVQYLSGITVFNKSEPRGIRFRDTTREVHDIQMATRLPGQEASRSVSASPESSSACCGGTSSSEPQPTGSDSIGSEPILPLALAPGSLCIYCRVACGRTVSCCEPDCQVAFHPLCAWFHGLSMTIENPNKRVLYAGGGAGLKFEVMCESHSPAELNTEELRRTEGQRRSRFRLDSYYVTQGDLLKKPPGMKPRDGLKSLTMALRSASSDENELDDLPMAELEMCSACFEYPSPIISPVPRVDSGGEVVDHVPTTLDVSKLSLRQFLLRCQNCNVFVHPGCCGNEVDPRALAGSRMTWTCDRCKAVDRNVVSSCACIVCDRTDGLLLPCLSTQPLLTDLSAANAMYSLAMGLDHVPQEANSLTNGFDKWIHVLCSKWARCKMTRKNKLQCATLPSSFISAEPTIGHCDLCSVRGKHVVKCARDGCHKRFHPFCAARSKGFYTVGHTTKSWRFYCFHHPPPSTVFDFKRQTWFTSEIMQHLQELRLSLERGRMLVEMCKRREKLKKASVLTMLLPLLEQSVDIVVKKRPSPSMKSMYNNLTGEILRDGPRKPPPPKPKVQPTRILSRKRRRTSYGGEDEIEAEAEAEPSLETEEVEDDSSSMPRSSRRRSLRAQQQQQLEDDEENRPTKLQKLDALQDTAGRTRNRSSRQSALAADKQQQAIERNKLIFRHFDHFLCEMDFDEVVPSTFTELCG